MPFQELWHSAVRGSDNLILRLEASSMRYNLYTDSAGYYRWRLYAANNRIIADSGEGYINRSDCVSAIDLVKASYSAPVA